MDVYTFLKHVSRDAWSSCSSRSLASPQRIIADTSVAQMKIVLLPKLHLQRFSQFSNAIVVNRGGIIAHGNFSMRIENKSDKSAKMEAFGDVFHVISSKAFSRILLRSLDPRRPMNVSNMFSMSAAVMVISAFKRSRRRFRITSGCCGTTAAATPTDPPSGAAPGEAKGTTLIAKRNGFN